MDDVIGKHLVTLAVVQRDCILGDVEDNLASIAHYSRVAAEPGPRECASHRSGNEID
jgi:hypothetical protein